jgi:tetratricopeptide (TPR) repeat protein
MGKNTRHLMSPSTRLEMRRTVENLSNEGKHLEACEVLEKLAAQSPRNPLIWNDLGVQYEAAGDIDKALAALKRGHKVDATYPPTLYNLGKFTLDRCLSLQRTGTLTEDESQRMLAQAIGFLNANLDQDPENADAHYFAAIAYDLSGDERRSQSHMCIALRLKEALTLPPGWAPLLSLNLHGRS